MVIWAFLILIFLGLSPQFQYRIADELFIFVGIPPSLRGLGTVMLLCPIPLPPPPKKKSQGNWVLNSSKLFLISPFDKAYNHMLCSLKRIWQSYGCFLACSSRFPAVPVSQWSKTLSMNFGRVFFHIAPFFSSVCLSLSLSLSLSWSPLLWFRISMYHALQKFYWLTCLHSNICLDCSCGIPSGGMHITRKSAITRL